MVEQLLRYMPRRLVARLLSGRLRTQPRLSDIAGAAGRINERLMFVVDGRWDLRAAPLSGSSAWRVMKSIHDSEGDWRQSEEFAPMVERVRRGYRGRRDCPMRGELDVIRYFESRAQLWRRCRAQGLGEDWRRPIRFAVGRDGRYFKVRDGAHRLACAYLLNLEPVPGIIWQIHPGFVRQFVQNLMHCRLDARG